MIFAFYVIKINLDSSTSEFDEEKKSETKTDSPVPFDRHSTQAQIKIDIIRRKRA